MPISLVRSVTLTSMMFMMPTPAASSAMPLMTKEPAATASATLAKEAMSDSLENSSKSLSSSGFSPRAMRMAVMALSMVSL